MSTSDHKYHVALSFAGENRSYVAAVAKALVAAGVNVFYDEYEAATLWGRDLYVHLRDVYQHQARYTIVFASEHYARKVWTGHERASAQARALKEKSEYILPARFDDTEIPGLLDTISYIDLRKTSPQGLVTLVLQKLGRRSGTWEVDDPVVLPGEERPAQETLRERAARLSEQSRMRQSREELLRSMRGVRLAEQEVKRMFEYIQDETAGLREQDPNLDIHCVVRQDGVLLVRTRRASFTLYLNPSYANPISNAALYTREYDGPHSLGYVSSEEEARRVAYVLFDVNDDLQPRWRDQDDTAIAFSTTQLADRYLSRVIERAYGGDEEHWRT